MDVVVVVADVEEDVVSVVLVVTGLHSAVRAWWRCMADAGVLTMAGVFVLKSRQFPLFPDRVNERHPTSRRHPFAHCLSFSVPCVIMNMLLEEPRLLCVGAV